MLESAVGVFFLSPPAPQPQGIADVVALTTRDKDSAKKQQRLAGFISHPAGHFTTFI